MEVLPQPLSTIVVPPRPRTVKKSRRLMPLSLTIPPLISRACLTTRSYHSLLDRKSTRLNSSHLVISYAVFCLKKKKKKNKEHQELHHTCTTVAMTCESAPL